MIQYDVRDRVALVTIDRAEKRNALSAAMVVRLQEIVEQVNAASAVRVAILTGAGNSAFCAGADLLEIAQATPETRAEYHRSLVELFISLRNSPKPLIAAVNGYAYAGGLGLVLACDLAISADTAQFATPEIKVGLWPMMVSVLLSEHVGPKRAAVMSLTGEPIDAHTALQWGIINEVISANHVQSKALEWAHSIASRSATAIHMGRSAMHTARAMDAEKSLRYLQEQLTLLSFTEDAREGTRAFLEKRLPHFADP